MRRRAPEAPVGCVNPIAAAGGPFKAEHSLESRARQSSRGESPLVISFLYLALRRFIELAALRPPLRPRSAQFKKLEIVVLPHQLAILRRQVARPALQPADCAFLAACQPAAASSPLVIVLRHSGDSASLASPAARSPLELPDSQARSAPDRCRGPRAAPAAGARECALGLAADRRRARRARDRAFGDQRPEAPHRGRARPSPKTRWPLLARVHPPPGREHDRL
jgi:hypothetical protein